MARVICKSTLGESEPGTGRLEAFSPLEKMQMVEDLRNQWYGWTDETRPRLQPNLRNRNRRPSTGSGRASPCLRHGLPSRPASRLGLHDQVTAPIQVRLFGHEAQSTSPFGRAASLPIAEFRFKEFLLCLGAEGVRYLLVGGYALAAHGLPRFTKDIDVWVACEEDNAVRILSALTKFGFGSLGLTKEDLLDPRAVVQLGDPPLRIDLLTGISGVEFDAAHARHFVVKWEDLDIPVIDREDLIANKRATGRLRDLADVEDLKRLK